MEKQKFIMAGIIGNPRGFDGYCFLNDTLKMISILPAGISARLGFSADFSKQFVLDDYSIMANGKVVAKLKGIDSKEDIAIFKSQGIFFSAEDVVRANPEFYSIEEILDCEVFDCNSGERIGQVIEVWEMPANDVWLIETDSGKLPIPVIDDIVKKVDLANSRIEIFKMDGLMDIIENSGQPNDED